MTGRTDCVDSISTHPPSAFDLTGSAKAGFGADDEILVLTTAGSSQLGTAFLLTSISEMHTVDITYQNYVGDGSGADGMCMHLGIDSMEGGRRPDDGIAVGFSLCLDEWNNNGDHGAIMTFGNPREEGEANYNVKTIWQDLGHCNANGGCSPITLFQTAAWEDVTVKITPSGEGASVTFTLGDTGWGGTAMIHPYVLPPEVYIGFGGRTGGATNNHHVKNVKLKLTCAGGQAACQRRRMSEMVNTPSYAKGCIDPAAVNYDGFAGAPDVSCQYDCDALAGGQLLADARCYLYDNVAGRWKTSATGTLDSSPWAGVTAASQVVVQGLLGTSDQEQLPLFDMRPNLSSQSLILRAVRMEAHHASGTDHGAVISLAASTYRAEFVEFIGNTQNGVGAGVIFAVNSTVSVSSSVFKLNRNLGLGAGVITASSGSRVVLSHSQFLGNLVENRKGLVCDCPKDTPSWTDPVSADGTGCEAWIGLDCHEARVGYSPPTTVLTECPQTCGICTSQICDPCAGLEQLLNTDLKFYNTTFPQYGFGGLGTGDKICRGTLEGAWHSSIDMTSYDPNMVCNINARSDGRSCNEYCEGMGRTCMHAQNNGFPKGKDWYDDFDICEIPDLDRITDSGAEWYKLDNGCSSKAWEAADMMKPVINRASRMCGCSSALHAPHSASCISVTNSAISATYLLFKGNTGGDVIVARASTLDASHTTFKGNAVEQALAGPASRGIISLWEGSTAKLLKVTFLQNVGSYAGAVYITNFGTAATFDQVQFILNQATAPDVAAGAIFAEAHAVVHALQCTFDRNSAASQVAAGAIYARNGVEISLTDVTLRDNEAVGHPTAGSVLGAGSADCFRIFTIVKHY
jgi:hypothetical protein